MLIIQLVNLNLRVLRERLKKQNISSFIELKIKRFSFFKKQPYQKFFITNNFITICFIINLLSTCVHKKVWRTIILFYNLSGCLKCDKIGIF